jgi:hypothetical protein
MLVRDVVSTKFKSDETTRQRGSKKRDSRGQHIAVLTCKMPGRSMLELLPRASEWRRAIV